MDITVHLSVVLSEHLILWVRLSNELNIWQWPLTFPRRAVFAYTVKQYLQYVRFFRSVFRTDLQLSLLNHFSPHFNCSGVFLPCEVVYTW